ncbi:MAG: c-type cytochrome [Brevundimonas sp.]|nr:c-type cytochrome [Brevundimonas sp.]
MRAILPTLSLLAAIGASGCDATPGRTDRAFSETGQIIAMSGGAGGAANACFTCHGLDGQGDGVAAPRLAGLDAGYLQKQMEDYASGLRQDDLMTRVAKGLDPNGRRAVAAYYASLPIPDAAPVPVSPAPALYSRGDPARGVVACAACHGDRGQGAGDGGNPQIAGQPYAYTLEQLQRWKTGARRNDPRGVMAAAVRPLSDPEAREIALWLSRQPASPARASAVASGSASVDAAARPAASRETRRPDRSDGA